MPFTEQTIDFLLENSYMDSKAWFEAHRADYHKYALQPMAELVDALTPALLAIDPQLVCIPKVGKSISRIWRDTRFSRDKSMFRDVMWCSFFREKNRGMPGFWFEFSPRVLRWGCGWYQTPPEVMARLRELILANDADWRACLAFYQAQDTFHLEADYYRRSRHPAQPEPLRQWLDLKSVCLTCDNAGYALLFSDALAQRLHADFQALGPAYRFFLKAWQTREAES